MAGKKNVFSIFDPDADDDDLADNQLNNGSNQRNSNSNLQPSNSNDRSGLNGGNNGQQLNWAAETAEDADKSENNAGSNPFDDVFGNNDENVPSSSEDPSHRPFTYAAGSEIPGIRRDSAYRRYVGNRNPSDVSDLLLRPGFRRYGLESNVIGSRAYDPDTGRSKFSASHAVGSTSSTSSVGFAGSHGMDSFYTNPNSTPETNSIRTYCRHVTQAGGSVELVIDPLAGSSDEVVVLELREKTAVFSFRSGQLIQVSVAEFNGVLQRNVAAMGFKLIFFNGRYFFEQERIWRFFMRQVSDCTITGTAFATNIAMIIHVSPRLSQFYVQNIVMDPTDGNFDDLIDAFNYALQSMAVDARGFTGSSFISILRPIALRCHHIQTPLRTLLLVVNDFPEYGSLCPYVMHVHLIVTQKLTVLVHQRPLNQFIDILDRFRLMAGDAPQFLLSYQMVHIGSRFAVYQCQRGNVLFNIGFLMPDESNGSS